MRRILFALGLIVIVVAGGIVVARATSSSIAGVGCDPTERTAYHIHTFLTIVDRGSRQHPPAGVGIHPEHLCLYWIHTHDASGIVHIEAPAGFRPTLGRFFAVWRQPLTRRRVGDFVVRPEDSTRIYINHVLYAGDPDRIVLRDHDSITIEIGPPFVPPIRGSFAGT